MALFYNRTFCTIISLIILFLSFVIIKVANGSVFTFVSLVLILSYILHMGTYVATELFKYRDNFLDFDRKTTCTAILFVSLCHVALTMGSVIKFKKRRKIKSLIRFQVTEKILNNVGTFCTILGIFPRIYIDINQIRLQMSGDYLKSLAQIRQYGWISVLAQFFYVGILILIFTSNRNKIRGRVILLSTCIWEVVTMLSGGRIYAISFILAMLYVYCIRVEKPNIKQCMLIGIFVYILCLVMSTIATIRRTGGFSYEILWQSVTSSFGENNPILKMLVEMGGTMKSVIFSMDNFPSYSEYAYGKSYIESIVSLIPFFGEKITNINHMIYIYNFKVSSYMGGSWLGEAYYNFSWFGCVYCYILGRVIGKFEALIKEDEHNGNYINSIIILSFIFYIITYMRDYFVRFTTPIQVCLVVLFFAYCIKNIQRVKK